MAEWREEWLEELKKWFTLNGKWTDGFLQVLFVLEDAKPGVWLQQDSRRKLKELKNILGWFGLFVSKRHGGYATKSKTLYKSWNRIFGFKLDSEYFLGYPKCCVESHYSHLDTLRFKVELYSLIKQVKNKQISCQRFRSELLGIILLNHLPCSLACEHSRNLAIEYRKIINKYFWLVKDLLAGLFQRKVQGIFQALEWLPAQFSKMNKLEQDVLSKMGLIHSDYIEILNDAGSFKQTVQFGKQIAFSRSNYNIFTSNIFI